MFQLFRLYFSFLLFLWVMLAGAGCQDNGSSPITSNSEEPTVTTTIAGLVRDDFNTPVEGVLITAQGRTTITNKNGFFVIPDVRVPKSRCLVMATKDGIFSARATVPQENSVTHIRLTLIENDNFKTSIDASKGGSVSVRGTTIEFPANCFVMETGTPYTGMVEIGIRNKPTTWYRALIGDLCGIRSDGSIVTLYCHQMFILELKSERGEKLLVDQGKKVSVQYGLPPNVTTEVYLWHFDETAGIWKEYSKAIRSLNGRIAEIGQSGVWLIAMPAKTGFVTGRVLDDNEPVPGIAVQVGQQEVFTDQNGVYECRVPTDITIIVSVNAGGNKQVGAAPRSVGSITENQRLVVDIPLTTHPAYLTGTLLDCNGYMVDGIVQAMGLEPAYAIAKDGRFKIQVEYERPLLVNSIGYDMVAGSGRIVDPIAAGTVRDIGTLTACDNADYTDIGLMSSSKVIPVLSPNGDYLAVGADYSVWIYSRKTGELVQEIKDITGDIRFSNDGTKLLISGGRLPHLEPLIVVYSTSTWKQIGLLSGAKLAIFMPGSQTILAVEKTTNDIVHYTVSGTELQRFHNDSPEIQLLTSHGEDEFAILFAANDSIVVERWHITNNISVGHFATSWGSPKFSDDGSVLGVGSLEGVRLYEVNTGKLIRSVNNINGSSFAISSDGRYYACNVVSAPFSIYEVSTGTAHSLPSYGSKVFRPLNFSGNGLWLAAGVPSNIVRVWRLSL